MNNAPFFNTGPEINSDKQWAFEVAYFTQHIGKVLKDLGNFLNSRDYVEARLLAAEMKQRAEYEKNHPAGLQDIRLFCKGSQAVQ